MASSLLFPLGAAFSKCLSTNRHTISEGKIRATNVQCTYSEFRARASMNFENGDELTLVKRRNVIGLVLGASILLINSFNADGAGLPPEQKPRLCDDACEKELENVPMVTTESGLQYKDIKVGEGPSPPVGFQAIQHAHSFSVKAFETRGELADLRKEFSALQKTQKRDQLRMKKLEEQAEAATKAQSIALQKAEAAVNVKKVAEAEKKEAEAKKAEAEKELRNALATKKAEIDAAYNQGMEDVAEDYRLQVKQACNKGFVLGWNAMAKQLDLPADSPWRKTKAMRLPCPLPSSQDESESEADAEDEGETLVRKTKSPPKIDLTGDEEVEAAPKKADFGTLSSDLLLVGRSVEETLAEIDAEVAADKVAEVAADKGTEVAAEKETEVLAVNDAKVVEQRGAEEILPESSEVPIQPSAQVEQA